MTNFSYNFAGAGAIRADSIDVTGTVTAASLVGPLTGNTTGTHTGPVASTSITLDNAALIAPPPNTSAELLAMTGLTSAAAWRLDQVGVASGTVASIGNLAGTLTQGGTPTVGHPLAKSDGGTIRSMYFDAGTDGLTANILDPAATSFVAGVRGAFVADPSGTSHMLMGRVKTGASAAGWAIYVNDSGDLIYYVSDGTNVFNATFASAVLAVGAAPIEVMWQLDRSGANPILRLRWSRNGATIGSTSVTCTSLATISSTSQEFGFGSVPIATPVFSPGTAVQWAFYATGSQAEGATKAQTVSQGLGWEA